MKLSAPMKWQSDLQNDFPETKNMKHQNDKTKQLLVIKSTFELLLRLNQMTKWQKIIQNGFHLHTRKTCKWCSKRPCQQMGIQSNGMGRLVENVRIKGSLTHNQ